MRSSLLPLRLSTCGWASAPRSSSPPSSSSPSSTSGSGNSAPGRESGEGRSAKEHFKSNCVMTCHLLIYRVRYLENGKIQRVSTYKAKGSAVPVWLPTEQRRVKCSINRPCLHACVLALGSSLSSSAGRRRRWKDKRIGAGKGRALLLLSRNERSHAPNLLPRWLPAIGESKRRWKRRIDKRKVHVG